MRRLAVIVLLLALVVCVPALAASTVSASGPTLELIAEPSAGVAPFIALIQGARRSIVLTDYELDDHSVERALVAAARRGVRVQVLLNGGYYGDRDDDNAAAFTYLVRHGVAVRYSPSGFALTHQKTLTVDDAVSAVMTLNFDGRYASTRDYAIVDRRPRDVHAITAVFNADWAARGIVPSGAGGDLVWSPGAAPAVVGMIDSARRSIELETEELRYRPALDALCAAAARGVGVEIVMTYASEWRDAFARLARCGASIRLYHGQRYYIHAKLLLVDGRRALVSSQNLTTTSLDDNRELGIEVGGGPVLQALVRDFAADDAGASAY